MIFNESDIDFSKIDWHQFEELCYDLLVKFQFHSMAWRQGGADKGRDIEAMRYITDSIVGPYQEKWFIECKHYTSGLGIDIIIEKLSWARAEKADHFLLITNSYLTQQTREWLLKSQESEQFRIHTIEGKFLKQQLLLFPQIIVKYFADDFSKLVKSMLIQWLYYNILPEPKALVEIHKNADLSKLDFQELAFLWHAYHHTEEALDNYCGQEDIEPIKVDFLIAALIAEKNCDYPVMKEEEREKFEVINNLGMAWFDDEESGLHYSSIQIRLPEKERLQVVLIKDQKNLDVRIAVGVKA